MSRDDRRLYQGANSCLKIDTVAADEKEMPGNPPSTAAPRPQAPAPWNPLDEAPPKHHSAAKHEAIPAPSSLAPLGDPHAPSPGIPAAFAPQPNPPVAAPPVAAPAPAAEPPVADAPADSPPAPVAPADEIPVAAPAPAPVAHANPPVAEAAPAATPVVDEPPAPAAHAAVPPPVARAAPAGTIASLLNPAPRPPKEPAFPTAGNGESAAVPAVKSMSEQIAASIAATRAAKPAQGATKMASITASGEIAGGANAPVARSDSAAPADGKKKKRRGRRKNKKNEKTTAPAAPVRVAAPQRKATPLSEVRKKPDAETKKGAKGAFFFTVLIVAGAGVGGQYAVNEGVITPPWAEPAVTVDDCVQGAQTLGSLAVGEEIDVKRVSCEQPGAQLVVAQVDSEDQCPVGVDGVVNTDENLFCVAAATDDADTDTEQ